MNKKYFFIIISVSIIVLMHSCKNKTASKEISLSLPESEVLLSYLESGDNYVNSKNIPSNINADVLYKSLNNNILVLDVRDEAAFNEGHIQNAMNITPDSILPYFENVIEPNSFDTIVFVCDIGMRSAFITSALRLLGYHNVFSLKFGICAWNSHYAESMWLNNLSSFLEDELEIEILEKGERGMLPVISTGETNPYLILRERVRFLLSQPIKDYFLDIKELSKDYSKYYIVKYWNENQNHIPQLKGAVQFSPRRSLSIDTDLLKLPTDKPIVVYCNSGTHASFVVAFLRIMGYEAYSLKYGVNAFMYNLVKKHIPEHAFDISLVNDFPLETKSKKVINTQSDAPILKVKGGC